MNFLKKYDRKGKCPVCGGKKRIGLRYKFGGRIGFYYIAKCRKCGIFVSDKGLALNIEFSFLALTIIIIGFSYFLPLFYFNNSSNTVLLIGVLLIIPIYFLMLLVLIKMVQSQYVEKKLDDMIRTYEIQQRNGIKYNKLSRKINVKSKCPLCNGQKITGISLFVIYSKCSKCKAKVEFKSLSPLILAISIFPVLIILITPLYFLTHFLPNFSIICASFILVILIVPTYLAIGFLSLIIIIRMKFFNRYTDKLLKKGERFA